MPRCRARPVHRRRGTKTWSRVASARGRLASSECTGVRPASAAGTTNAPTPSPARAMTTMSVVPSAARMPELLSRQGPPAIGWLGRHGDVVDRPARGWSASATVAGNGARGHAGEEALLLLGGADLAHHGSELGDRGQERPRGDGPAQLLDDDGRLENGQADAAVLLGDGQGGPVEGHHGAPQLLGGLAGLDDGAHDVDGAFLLEERADRGAQFFLLTRELELHRTPFPACRLPLGRPPAPQGAGRSGRVYLTPMSASVPVLPSRRPVFWEGRGWVCPWGVAGPRRKPGPATRGACATAR